jgi:hypothetical protein
MRPCQPRKGCSAPPAVGLATAATGEGSAGMRNPAGASSCRMERQLIWGETGSRDNAHARKASTHGTRNSAIAASQRLENTCAIGLSAGRSVARVSTTNNRRAGQATHGWVAPFDTVARQSIRTISGGAK